jgi:hypothetical protein
MESIFPIVQLSVSGSFKRYNSTTGRSESSGLTVTVDVPAAASKKEISKEILKLKFQLDLTVLRTELLKGSISQEFYDGRRNFMVESYKADLSEEGVL